MNKLFCVVQSVALAVPSGYYLQNMNKQNAGSNVGSRYLNIHEREYAGSGISDGTSGTARLDDITTSMMPCRQQGHDVRFDSHSVMHEL